MAPSTPMPPALVTAATTSRQWVKAKIGNSMPSRSQISVCMVGLQSVGVGSVGCGGGRRIGVRTVERAGQSHQCGDAPQCEVIANRVGLESLLQCESGEEGLQQHGQILRRYRRFGAHRGGPAIDLAGAVA